MRNLVGQPVSITRTTTKLITSAMLARGGMQALDMDMDHPRY